jgi:hypothetical protein
VRGEAIGRFFTILRQADVPPEQFKAKLIEIAQRYQDLLAPRSEAVASDASRRKCPRDRTTPSWVANSCFWPAAGTILFLAVNER